MGTPRPWIADGDNRPGMEWNIHILSGEDPDVRICFMTSDGPAQENAALIVHAVNNIERITAERDSAMAALERIRLATIDVKRSYEGRLDDIFVTAKAALTPSVPDADRS